jgi:hypothetical protein
MAVKKSKVKVKPKSKLIREKVVAKSKKVVLKKKPKSISIAKNPKAKSDAMPSEKISIKPVEVRASVVKRNPALLERRRPIRNLTIKLTKQFNFMKAPLIEHAFEVGDNVEVFCDHEKSKERIRGWIKGIVVQVDNKMVAVQFRSNVFLTDGWMVPDRILWYPVNSEHIRPLLNKKAIVKKEFVIPDY